MRSEWEEALERHRAEKDEYFRSSANSPIPPDRREAFGGLSYYPPDPDYRFEVPLREHDEKERVAVGTSADGEREYLRWGEFRIEVDGEEVDVQAYKSSPDDDRLWVPFRDGTSGDETYGAGRYLDLEPGSHRVDDGDGDGGDAEWTLDFNEAYNPTCAYADAYECPLPPAENWLDVDVRAGERNYQSPHESEDGDGDGTAPF